MGLDRDFESMTSEDLDEKFSNTRVTPEDGHVVLLIETEKDNKTFTDSPNLRFCLDGIMELYEKYLETKGESKKGYDMDKLYSWIDEFERMELFIFDRELSRYKRNSREELKQHFITQIEKLQEEEEEEEAQASISRRPNGHNNNNHNHQNGLSSRDDGIGEDEEEEANWDI